MKFIILFSAIFFICGSSPAHFEPSPFTLENISTGSISINATKLMLIADDIETVAYKLAHPNEIFQEIPRSAVQSRAGIQYTLGNPGDGLVGFVQDSVNFGGPVNVQLVLNYPNEGQGAVVSFVVVNVYQSTNQGQAYVVAGGIGQRFIKLVVESYGTSYLQYQAYFFGHY